MRRTVQLPDRDRLLEALIAEADKVIELESATLFLEKLVSVRSTTKILDRLRGLAYEA